MIWGIFQPIFDTNKVLKFLLDWSGYKNNMWAVACDFQKCGVLTGVESDKPVQPLLSLETPNDVQSVA